MGWHDTMLARFDGDLVLVSPFINSCSILKDPIERTFDIEWIGIARTKVQTYNQILT